MQQRAPEDPRGVLDVQEPCNRPSLAIIQRFKRGQLISMFLNQVRQFQQQPAPFVAWHFKAPGGVIGFLGGRDGDVNIFF